MAARRSDVRESKRAVRRATSRPAALRRRDDEDDQQETIGENAMAVTERSGHARDWDPLSVPGWLYPRR